MDLQRLTPNFYDWATVCKKDSEFIHLHFSNHTAIITKIKLSTNPLAKFIPQSKPNWSKTNLKKKEIKLEHKAAPNPTHPSQSYLTTSGGLNHGITYRCDCPSRLGLHSHLLHHTKSTPLLIWRHPQPAEGPHHQHVTTSPAFGVAFRYNPVQSIPVQIPTGVQGRQDITLMQLSTSPSWPPRNSSPPPDTPTIRKPQELPHASWGRTVSLPEKQPLAALLNLCNDTRTYPAACKIENAIILKKPGNLQCLCLPFHLPPELPREGARSNAGGSHVEFYRKSLDTSRR